MPQNGTAEILDLEPDYGLNVTYTYENYEHESLLAIEYINTQKHQAVANFSFKFALFYQADFEYLRDFYYFHLGATQVFCFLDPFDNYASSAPTTNLSISTQGVVFESEGRYQLGKKYTLSTQSGDYSVLRPITRPMQDNIQLYDIDMVPIAATVDWDTGEVLTGGELTTFWEGSFYVPCRFANANLPNEIIGYDPEVNRQYYSIPDLELIEVKEFSLELPSNTNSIYDYYYSLAFEIGSRIDYSIVTDVFTSESGYEKRDFLDNGYRLLALLEQLVSAPQKDYIVGLWRVCLGSNSFFKFIDTELQVDLQVRFAENISLQTVSFPLDEPWNAQYRVSNIVLKEQVAPVHTYYCHLWKIVRTDGISTFLTDHDSNIDYDSNIYSCNLGASGTTPQQTAELNIDSTEMESVVLEIQELDLITNKYANADVEVYLYDWLNRQVIKTLFTGSIGGYSMGFLPNQVKQYQFELVSLTEVFESSASVETSSECRKEFLSQGEGRCNRPIDTDVRVTSFVTGGAGNILQVGTGQDNWEGYKYGTVKFVDGDLAGTKIYIADADGLILYLLYEPAIPVAIGVQVELTRSCSKTSEACNNYNNMENYGGFPSLSGIDLIVSGPDT